MIIDCHVHLLPGRVKENRSPYCESDPAFGVLYRSEKAKLASPQDILDYLDRSGIDKAVVFGFPWMAKDLIRINNDEVWDFHSRASDRIIPFAVLSPTPGEATACEAERTISGGFAGIGELAVYECGWNAEGFSALRPVLQLAAANRVPVMIHVNEPVGHGYPGKVHVDFSALLTTIEENLEVDFILAHFGGGVFVYGLMPEVAKILSRTYLDTAAAPFLYDPKIYSVVADVMGHEKILFGSDYPLLPLSRYLKDFDRAGLASSVREGLLGDNVLALLRKGRGRI